MPEMDGFEFVRELRQLPAGRSIPVVVLTGKDLTSSERIRLHAYEEATRPLTAYYERAGKLVSIPASGAPEEILTTSLQALNHRLSTKATEIGGS